MQASPRPGARTPALEPSADVHRRWERARGIAAAAGRDTARRLAHPRAPLVVLGLLLLLSLGARINHLALPCAAPCRTTASHTLIFDESYYVNAARVIDHIRPPAAATYHDAPLGQDPNAEHPQLAKLVIAATMRLFGDGPWGWRTGSVLFGLFAALALFALVRVGGGGRWCAVGAVAVMASDNLLLVHGRIATLDIYAVALMLMAGTCYLRRWPVAAGVLLATAAAMKEVALSLLLVFVVLEALELLQRRRWSMAAPAQRPLTRVRGLGLCLLATVLTLVGLVWLLDTLVPAHDLGTGITYGGNPLRHLAHIYHYGVHLTGPPNATGISSTPWDWLFDQKPIDYARVAVNSLVGGKVVAVRPIVLFRGEINPFIIFLAIPALCTAMLLTWRDGDRLALLGVAWCLGTYPPFLAQSALTGRITYLYYMVIVMPGVYLVLVRLFDRRRMPTAATAGWALTLVLGLVHLYPIRTWSGR